MAPTLDGRAEPGTRTMDLAALVRGIVDAIKADFDAAPGDVFVETPDSNAWAAIIPGILEKIERADLVLIDFTGNSPNVTYEAGLVHALGLPHIFITSDAAPVFYFRNAFCLPGFDPHPGFDPARPGHAALRDRIRTFYKAWYGLTQDSSIADLASNAVSAFFDNIPIVDISAPAGLAAGYWQNAIRRFIRRGGYVDTPHKHAWAAQQGLRAGQDMRVVEHVIAVRPPDDLRFQLLDAQAELEGQLARLGLRRFQATIHHQAAEDLRDYSGFFLGRIAAPRAREAAPLPVMLEIPATLYALHHSPRIRRIRKGRRHLAPQAPEDAIDIHLRRRYRDMIGRFGMLMAESVREEALRNAGRFHFVAAAELPALLTRIGVLA